MLSGDSENNYRSWPQALNLAVFAGDASGDYQTAFLVAALRRRVPGLRLWGVGGRHLREAGVDLLYDTSRVSAIGFMQAARLIPELLKTERRTFRLLRKSPPDMALAVDFGAFNLRITPFIRSLEVPVAYWFPPGSWRKKTPSERILKAADYFISPYPWYAENLRAAGAQAVFLGHPLIDQVKPRLDLLDFQRKMDLPENSRIVALLPGSRGHEVIHILPFMLDAARIIWEKRQDVSFVVPVSDHFPVEAVGQLLKKHASGNAGSKSGQIPVALARGATQETLCHASAAAVCSGSATLESLVAGTPMVVVYRGSKIMKLEYKVRRVNIRFMGMPNILADKELVPELRQDEASGANIAAHLLSLLDDTPERKNQIEGLAQVREFLMPSGAIERTADALLNFYARTKGLPLQEQAGIEVIP